MEWAAAPLKYVARINQAALLEDTDPDLEIRYLDISAVGSAELVSEPQVLQFGDAPSRARRLVRSGDTIVSTVRTYLRAVYPVRDEADGLVVSTGFAVLSPLKPMDPRYFAWWAQASPFIDEVVALSRGVSYPAINASDLGRIEVPTPSPVRQRAIAEFLDAETGRIDALIGKKRDLVALIGERRISLTTAGVSGRLTGTGNRAASSLDWIDSVPEHWSEVGLTLVAQLGSGHTPSRRRDDWWIESECTIPWITTGEVARLRSDRVEYIEETRENISPIGLENSAAEAHPAGTVVLCRTASAGYSGIMRSDMATSQDFATWTCGPRLRPRFLLLCLRAMRDDLLGRLAMGSTHKTIYMPDIQSLRIPLPPVEEQDEIVVAVWWQLDRDGHVEDLLTRQIDLLTERRQALITAAVTGELDVAGSTAEEAS